MENKILEICFGAVAEPISEQLKQQGFNLPENSMKYFDRIKDALNTLQFNDLTTYSMHRQLIQRANKYIVNQVQRWYQKQNS